MLFFWLFAGSPVLALLDSLNLTSVYPVYQSFDNDPYIVTSILTDPQLYISFNVTEDTDIYLNSQLVSVINTSSTVLFTLQMGYNTISIVDSLTTEFTVPYSLCTDLQHSVTLGTVTCTPYDCGSTTLTSVTFTAKVAGYSTRLFSISKRYMVWTQVSTSITYQLNTGYNYLRVLYGNCAMTYKIYKVPDNSMSTSVQILGVNAYLKPRFTPDVYVYTVQPMLDSVIGLTYGLVIDTYTACSLTYVSTTGLWTDVSGTSSVAVNGLFVIYPSDLVYITSKDSSGKTSKYYLTFSVKSANRYLQAFRIYNSTEADLLTYDAVTSCCNSTQINTTETFASLTTSYSIPDQDYAMQNFTYIVSPQDSLSIVYLNNQEYLGSSKTITPTIGNNHIEVLVQAQDPGFNLTYTFDFYMRGNISTMFDIISPIPLQPIFSPTILIYRLYLDYYTTSIPFTFIPTDAKSLVNLATSTLTTSSFASLSTTVPFPINSLSQYISLPVSAETVFISTEYSITLIRNDCCGNGIRYSTSEECDDGNLISNDGCSPSCQIEINYTCTGGSETTPDICEFLNIPIDNSTIPICGNGIVETGEECDDGNKIIKDGCTDCKKDPKSICGNGIVETGEECDDGNNITNDGCTLCKKDSNGRDCGDGIRAINSIEECDDGNFVDYDGCTNCIIDVNWTCNNNSLITNVHPSPDVCVKVNFTENNTNSTEESQSSRSALDEGFDYVGTICFFIVCTGSLSLTLAVLLLKDQKIGIAIVPGVVFLLWAVQQVYCINMATGEYKRFFEAFAWAHLRFHQVANLNSRVTLDVLGLEYGETSIFVENIQYFLYVLGGLVVLNAVAALFVVKKYLIKIQIVMYLTFFLTSAIPIMYFAGLSLVVAELSNYREIISYIFGIIIPLVYIAILIYIPIILKSNQESPENSTTTKIFSAGLKTKTLTIKQVLPKVRSSPDKKKYPKIIIERFSLNEDQNDSNELPTSSRKNHDKTTYKIRSEPIAEIKYKSPEFSTSELQVPAYPNLYLTEFALLCIDAFIYGVLRDYEIAAISVSICIYLFLIGLISYTSPFQHPGYSFLHMFFPGVLILTLCFLYNELTSGVYYIIVFFVFGLLVAFLAQFVRVVREFIGKDEEGIREFTLSNHEVSVSGIEPSISYIRDSIPEERAPGSATINNFSYEASAPEIISNDYD